VTVPGGNRTHIVLADLQSYFFSAFSCRQLFQLLSFSQKEFILALVLFLVVVVGIISIDHRLKRIVKILEEKGRREIEARRVRGLEPL